MSPVRELPNRGGNIVGIFPSIKMGRGINFHSLIERDYLYLLDYDPTISFFEEQPFTIDYYVNGAKKTYIPAFHIVRGDQHILVECSLHNNSILINDQEKFKAAEYFCSKRGWFFRIVNDLQIHLGFQLKNIKTLKSCAKHSAVTPATLGCIYSILQDTVKPVNIRQILESSSHYYQSGVILTTIFYMAYHHLIEIPINDAPISLDTPVNSYKTLSGG